MVFGLLNARLATGADLSISTQDEQFVFAGIRSVISVAFENHGERADWNLQYRLYQASSATLMPASPLAAIATTKFLPGVTTVVRLEVNPPSVRTITSYRMKFYEGGSEIGSISLRSCPTNLLSGLKAMSPQVAIYDRDSALAALLGHNEVNVVAARSAAEESFSGTLVIACLRKKEDLPAWTAYAASLPPGKSVLYIVSPGIASSEKLLPLKFIRSGPRPAAILQDWYVPNLGGSPLSQLRLLHSIELLLKPEVVKPPESVTTEL